jgi:O-antigen ligase
MLKIQQLVPTSTLLRAAMLLMLLPLAAFIGWAAAHQLWLPVGALIFVPLYLLWPVQMSLGVFAFLVPFEAVAMAGGSDSMSLTWVAGVVAGGGLLVVGLVDHRFERPPKAARWWFLFLALAAASVLWAYNPERTLTVLSTFVSLIVLYVVAVSIRISDRELEWVAIMAIAGAVLASFLTTTGFFSGMTYKTVARATIAEHQRQADPNYYAAGLLLALSLAVGRTISKRGIAMKLVMGGSAAMIAAAVLLTMSRGALLGILVMMAVYALRYRMNWKLLVPIALLASGLFLVPEEFFHRIQIAVSSGGAGRLDIWTAGFHAFMHYWAYGAGFGNFSSVYTLFAGYAPNFMGFDLDAHNMYLATSVELGIAGILIMAIAFYTQLQDAKPSRSPSLSVRLQAVPTEAAMWAALTTSTFLNPILRKYLWLTLIMVALSVKSRQAHEPEVQEPVTLEPEDTFVTEDEPITSATLAVGLRRR